MLIRILKLPGLLSLFLFSPLFAVEAAVLAELDRVRSVCAACHGNGGLGTLPGVPNLAGQKPGYLREQMWAFRDGERINPQMPQSMLDISNDLIDALVDFYSTRPLPAASAAGAGKLDPTLRPLVFCVRCHGSDGISPNDIWPNLAGQNLAYLKKQMQAYAEAERTDDMMSMWSGMVDAAQLGRILDYFSQQGSYPAKPSGQ